MENTKTYTLYGVKAQSIHEAAKLAERVLGVKFELRNGLHMGGDYYKYWDQGLTQSMTLKENITDDPDEIHEVDFPQYRFLLYVAHVPSDAPFNVALMNAPDRFEKLRVRYR